MVFAHRPATAFTALAATCAMVLSLASCASNADTHTNDGQTTITMSSTGAVALFTPSDGITLSQQTPLNKWAKLTPDLTASLTDAGFKKDNITHTTSDSLDKQSRAIQDYVVSHLSDKGKTNDTGIVIEPENMTLLVAPVVEADASTRQYGDYVSQELRTTQDESGDDADTSANGSSNSSSADSSSGSTSGSSDSKDSADAKDSSGSAARSDSADSSESSDDASSDSLSDATDSADTADDTQAEAADRLVSSLKLAKESGMHVVLLGNSIEGYKPDAFVKFTDAQTIGKLQAEKIVSKLQLAKASKDNPKRIEVLLPYTPVKNGTSDDASDSASGDASGAVADTDESAFAQEAFRGIWQVLGAYYEKGVAESPSGTLNAKTTENDWQAVAYDASKEGSSAKVLAARLESSTDSPTRVDAVFALNDYVASEVVSELKDLGYTGSAADINPQITISGIVGNIAGKKDLARQAVPDPIKSPENDTADQDAADEGSTKDEHDASSDKTDKARDSQWPLVTGYGAYISNIPSVVNGKQWMTGITNRKAIASDIADACVRLNTGKALSGMSSVRNGEVGGVAKVPVISEPPLAVSASNLKAALIDPGYITLADAGL